MDRQEPSTNVTDTAALLNQLTEAQPSKVIFRRKGCYRVFSQSYPTLKGVLLVGTGSHVGHLQKLP